MSSAPPGSPGPNGAPRNRLEDEVLEILHRVDHEPAKVIQFQRKAQRRRLEWSQSLRKFTPKLEVNGQNLIIACVALAILSVIFQGASPAVAKLLAVLSFAALVWAIIRPFFRPRGGTTKRWRGRDIEF